VSTINGSNKEKKNTIAWGKKPFFQKRKNNVAQLLVN